MNKIIKILNKTRKLIVSSRMVADWLGKEGENSVG